MVIQKEGVAMRLDTYLNTVEDELKVSRGSRERKVEKSILEVVQGCIENEKPATIKYIAEALGKSTQQIHQSLRKATSVKKVKHQGRTLVVPSEME
jgi:hypothetical protein